MHFVGREKEIGQIKKALDEGMNVIVSGKYGMGRTTLIRHIADTTEDRWRFLFVDFSRTPGEVCSDLLGQLFPERRSEHRQMSYRSSRFRLTALPLSDRRKQILVLDSIAKLSYQKLDLLRCLTWEKRFQFVSIVERFLPAEDLFRLRVRMNPAILLTLHYLNLSEVAQFYRELSEVHGLGWTEDRIQHLAEVTGGYPLRMKEIALRELAVPSERKRISSSSHGFSVKTTPVSGKGKEKKS